MLRRFGWRVAKVRLARCEGAVSALRRIVFLGTLALRGRVGVVSRRVHLVPPRIRMVPHRVCLFAHRIRLIASLLLGLCRNRVPIPVILAENYGCERYIRHFLDFSQ